MTETPKTKKKHNWMKGFVINPGPPKTISEIYERENYQRVQDRVIAHKKAVSR
jgi:hypothetical protein